MFIQNNNGIVRLHNFAKVQYINDVLKSIGYHRCDNNGVKIESPLTKAIKK